MKTIFKVIFVSLLFGETSAQTNLFPNGSFETYTSCPTKINDMKPDQVAKATDWYTIKGTPDYFNACSTSTMVGTGATNFFGYQMPHSGYAYMGLWSFQHNLNPVYRECISAKLTSNLVLGQKYFLKITVSSTDGYVSNCGIDKIGLRFSTVKQTTLTNSAINNFAHLFAATIVTNTVGWTTVFGSFVADSNYQYVEIANFYDDVNTNYQVYWTGANWAYLYLDDVCASTDSLFALNWTPDLITSIDYSSVQERNLALFPNPCSNALRVDDGTGAVAAELHLFDSFGSLVSVATNSNELDVSSLPDGVYFIKVKYADRSFYENIIVQH